MVKNWHLFRIFSSSDNSSMTEITIQVVYLDNKSVDKKL